MYEILTNMLNDSIRAYYGYVYIQKLGFNPDNDKEIEKLTNQVITKIEKDIKKITEKA